jgi:hypothetical protein
MWFVLFYFIFIFVDLADINACLSNRLSTICLLLC